METPTYWPQVLTIVVANVSVMLGCFSMFLWVARQARADYLHIDKKFEDNRKDMNAILDRFTNNSNALLRNFEKRLPNETAIK